MFKFAGVVMGLAVLGVSSPLLAQDADAAPLGPDAAVCRRGNAPSVLVRIPAFKTRTGKVRVQIYGSNPADFLAKGKWLRRVDLPVARSGPMDVCVSLPRPGNYAVAVRHDLDGNGKSGWSDGGGFSRNPSLSLLNLKPDYRKVAISVGAATRPVEVYLNYRHGLAISPLK